MLVRWACIYKSNGKRQMLSKYLLHSLIFYRIKLRVTQTKLLCFGIFPHLKFQLQRSCVINNNKMKAAYERRFDIINGLFCTPLCSPFRVLVLRPLFPLQRQSTFCSSSVNSTHAPFLLIGS